MTPIMQQILECLNEVILPTTTYAQIAMYLIQNFPLMESNILENRYRFEMEEIMITLVKYPTFFVLSIAERTELHVISKVEGVAPISIKIESN